MRGDELHWIQQPDRGPSLSGRPFPRGIEEANEETENPPAEDRRPAQFTRVLCGNCEPQPKLLDVKAARLKQTVTWLLIGLQRAAWRPNPPRAGRRAALLQTGV
ncbi:hypothetical protein AAFF_G00082710 [Aldrovandia affinis]|uniref:Uncharacterized protein n=1 Tax=Aldrovandia affinis TaxID=143900 RepID=A0AAD7WCB9_9TELE|nr:hypothetical protein AAFF_G00082710 [Aldrovandia affinis]